jgi:antagonist of KipI
MRQDAASTLGMKASVVRAGFLTTVQDLGRIGTRQFGVSVGGALDRHAMRVGNLLTGNNEEAAGIEITSGHTRLQFADKRIVAWCGGEYKVVVEGRPIPPGHSALINANDELSISGPHRGCRGWLAISGGIDVPVILGSRSTDLRGSFGGLEGRLLRDGDNLPLGEQSERAVGWVESLREQKIAPWAAPSYWSDSAQAKPLLRVIRGADWERFDASSQKAFFAETFIVTADSDRMGARLEGPELKRTVDVDLVSEGVSPGTIQIPPNGKPIVLLGDCQTIGGYPKITHVITIDLSAAAQLRDGDRVRFVEVSLADAHHLQVEREQELGRFRVGLSLRNL